MKYIGKCNIILLCICSCFLFFLSCKTDVINTVRNEKITKNDRSTVREVAEHVIASMKSGDYARLKEYVTNDYVIDKLKGERNTDIAIDIDATSELTDISFVQILTSNNVSNNYFYDTIEQNRFAYYFSPTNYNQFFYIFTVKENCEEHEIIFFLDFADVSGEWKLSNIELGHYKYNGMNGPKLGGIAMNTEIDSDLMQSYLLFGATSKLLDPAMGRFVFVGFQEDWTKYASQCVRIYQDEFLFGNSLYENSGQYVEIAGLSVILSRCNILPVFSCMTNIPKSDTSLLKIAAEEVNTKIDNYYNGVTKYTDSVIYLLTTTPNDPNPVRLRLRANDLDI